MPKKIICDSKSQQEAVVLIYNHLRLNDLSQTLGRSLLFCLVLVYASQNRWLIDIDQKKAACHSMAIFRDGHKGDREKSSSQTALFNI